MGEENKNLEITDPEFDPLVVIVADDRARYESFAAHLVKNGFKCELHDELPESLLESPVPGTIFFVSFNLKTSDASLLARRIEQKNNLCIVFAEQQGIETAAKLSSAKLTQTLQHPYTEKNFTMAVQTIVKKRRVQLEKDLRKQSHLERRKGMIETQAVTEETGNQIFRADVKTESGLTPLIFEERVRGKKIHAVIEGQRYVSGHSHFAHDRRKRGLMEIQKGLVGSTFTVMPSQAASGTVSTIAKGSAATGSVAHVSGSKSSASSALQDGAKIEPGTTSVHSQTSSGNPATMQQQKPASESSSTSQSAEATKLHALDQQSPPAADSGKIAQSTPDTKAMSIGTETKTSSDGIAYMPSSKDGEATKKSDEKGSAAISAATKDDVSSRSQKVDSSGEAALKKAKLPGETLVGYSKDDLRKEGSRSASLPETEAIAEDSKISRAGEPTETKPEVTKIAGNIAVPTWALIAAASIGILFLLFFLFQMMFQRH